MSSLMQTQQQRRARAPEDAETSHDASLLVQHRKSAGIQRVVRPHSPGALGLPAQQIEPNRVGPDRRVLLLCWHERIFWADMSQRALDVRDGHPWLRCNHRARPACPALTCRRLRHGGRRPGQRAGV